jgi:hypothetical protein
VLLLFDPVDEVTTPVVLQYKRAEVLIRKGSVVVFVKEFKVMLVFSRFIRELNGFGGFGLIGSVEVVVYCYCDVKNGF